MAVEFFKEIGVKNGTSRLFIGGLHGKEGLSTIHALKNIKNINVTGGSLVLCNLSPSPYLSTLDPLYYLSSNGSKLLDLIKNHQPEIYLELHCYHPEKSSNLTVCNRKDIFGVPALIELKYGVLMGYVSPLIRAVFFGLNDLPFILEMPCNPSTRSLEVSQEIMEITANSSNRVEIMKKLGKIYPQQVKRLDNYFHEFSLNFWPAFQEVKQEALKTDLKNLKDLDQLISRVICKGNFDLNPVQIGQLSQVFLIFREYKI
jgi:hypothetical protein